MRRRRMVAAGTAAALAAALGGAGAAQAATVTVRPGETLGAIAARSGVSVGALARANALANPNRVVAGRLLRLPATGAAPLAAAASGRLHRVRPGETLSAIAARYGVGVRTLARLNGLASPHRIVVGRVLRLPGATPVAPAPAPDQAPAASGPSVLPARTADVVSAPPPGVDWGKDHVAALMADSAVRLGVDPGLVRAIAWQESGWDQGVVSNVGARGVMQLMPDTAAWLGPALLGRQIDPALVEDNVEGGVAYLGWLLRATGDTPTAIGAYYQGLRSVRKRGMIPETKRYVANVLALIGRV